MARPNKPRTTNRYSAEFKLNAVKLSQIDGVQVEDVAEALGTRPFMLSRWRKEVRDGVIRACAAVVHRVSAHPKRSDPVVHRSRTHFGVLG
ncbi:MAG: transposase [Actinomycetota bacterium]